jgi:V/A-type H+-transporting ATPase subunit C
MNSTMHDGAGNYPYACARVKSRKTLLLPADTYPRLLNMDLAEISRFMGEGQYRKEIDELSSKYSYVDLIEHATYLNMARTYQAVMGFTKGELNAMVSYFLNRWDIYNFETVLRGRTAGIRWEVVEEDIVPAGAFDLDFFRALFGAAGPDEMIATLKGAESIYGLEPLLLKLLRDAHGTLPGQAELENELQREYYMRLLAAVPDTNRANRLFLDYLRAEIDTVNLKTLFKLKFEDVAVEKVQQLLIPAGEELGPPVLRALAAAQGFDAFLSELSGLRLFEAIREPASLARSGGSLNGVLLALDRHLMARAQRFSRLYPLSVLPIIDYLLRKKTEVDNLRIIARGKQSGLSNDVIKGLLMV